MKAEELRIGNLVAYQDGRWFKVYEIDELGLRVRNSDEDTWIEHEYFEGIPLTPEILEKAGFVQPPYKTVHNVWYREIGRKRLLSVGCVGTPNEIISISEANPPEVSEVIIVRNFDYDGKTYLHQLQNLIFDLTGEELKISI